VKVRVRWLAHRVSTSPVTMPTLAQILVASTMSSREPTVRTSSPRGGVVWRR
jgi:hypothetical protein